MTIADAGIARARQNALAVVDRPEDERAVLQRAVVVDEAVDRRQQRTAAGGDDERVVRLGDAACAGDRACGEIEPLGADAGVERDAVASGTTPAG